AVIDAVTGGLTWIPNSDQLGPHAITILVVDSGGLDDIENLIVNVMAPPFPVRPVLASIGPRTIEDGQLLTFIASASDANDGQNLTFSLENGTGQMPQGAVIDPTTGVFTYRPDLDVGPNTFTFDVVVTDD